MLYDDLVHWEIVGVSGGECGAESVGSGSDEAVGLVEGDSTGCEVSPPMTGLPALEDTKGCQAKCIEQAISHRLLAFTESSPDLLDRDDTNPGLGPNATHRPKPIRGGPAAKGIDEDRGVEQDPGHQ